MKCPICKTPMKVNEYFDGQIVVEEFHSCDDGCGLYTFDWSYGFGIEYIRFAHIPIHWRDTKAKTRKLKFIRKEILKRERRRYRRLGK